SHIVFIVRADGSNSALLFQTSDTGWQAYNNYGGNSLYVGSPGTNPGRAYKVSYNRPFFTRGVNNGQSWLFNAEYPMVRWLESNGYDISYFTGVDSDRVGSQITQHKVFVSVGHDEYWSAAQRANVEAARTAGIHLAFFSGNELFWKTRWENSIDGTNTAYRTLVCFKETHANQPIDPADPPIWTGSWRDPRFSPPDDGGRPENALTGTIFVVNGPRTDAITVPSTYGKLRFWRNTSVASLAPDSAATLPDGTLGYEWDSDLDNGSRPAGLFDLSSTALDVSGYYLLDNGSTYGAGTATHSLTLYRSPSGSLVFGAGTVQWSWGLDGNHDNGDLPPNHDMQQSLSLIH
ncbi:MAG: N,N-dimethylformamidase beta subunit family domain-containing protein, partial [Thermoanaerobaculia bacterium]